MKKLRGIGLYSWRQVRYETAITFSGGIVFGLIFFAGGLGFVWWGETAGIRWFGIGMVATGIFLGHAGVIYCWGRIFRHARKSG